MEIGATHVALWYYQSRSLIIIRRLASKSVFPTTTTTTGGRGGGLEAPFHMVSPDNVMVQAARVVFRNGALLLLIFWVSWGESVPIDETPCMLYT